ncbi:MAG TPA: aspartate/glutamate racemase family protein [Candidatus Baltobacteraceae bacterium]|nr:aspartate/glutamate racemase family protein [Candidatus Baltobacteraceae bacterium]
MKELNKLFADMLPEAEVRNIVDDSLLPEVLAHSGVTAAVHERMKKYFQAAESAGADLIFNQCSSVGEAADAAAQGVSVPVIKVDARMAEVACQTGRRIGVVATLETTLGPTCRLIERTASRLGRQVEISRCLVAGAFDVLIGGNRAKHNQMVLAAIRDLVTRVDVVVCAQGSMTAILPELGQTAVPVLTSPVLGVESAVSFLRGSPSAAPKMPVAKASARGRASGPAEARSGVGN